MSSAPLPTLTPLSLEISMLQVRTARCKKRNKPAFAVMQVQGELVDEHLDAMFIRWRGDELISLEIPVYGLILDLSGLLLRSPAQLQVVPPRLRILNELFRVVLPTGCTVTGDWAPDEVRPNLRSALLELATEELQDVSLAISDLVMKGFQWRDRTLGASCLTVRIAGSYGIGSEGNDDALLMRWRFRQLKELTEPVGVVVDLREFHYFWGDQFSPKPAGFFRGSPLRYIVRADTLNDRAYGIWPEQLTLDEATAYEDVQQLVANPNPVPVPEEP